MSKLHTALGDEQAGNSQDYLHRCAVMVPKWPLRRESEKMWPAPAATHPHVRFEVVDDTTEGQGSQKEEQTKPGKASNFKQRQDQESASSTYTYS
jgi:hypothetical protein